MPKPAIYFSRRPLLARLTRQRTAVLNGIHKLLRKHNLEHFQPTKEFQAKKVRAWHMLTKRQKCRYEPLIKRYEEFDAHTGTAEAMP